MELLKLQPAITKNILSSYHAYVKNLIVITNFINISVKGLIISDQDLSVLLITENTVSSSKIPLKSNLRVWFGVRMSPSRFLISVPTATAISIFNLQSNDPRN